MVNIPLAPKCSGKPLRVIIIGRLSRMKETEQQTQLTIDSSFAYAKEFIGRSYPGEVEFRELGEQISGLVVNRKTIAAALDLIETGDWDLVLTEDLSRIYRNPRHQYSFVQDCVDAGVRLICIADNLDTADENWETMLGTAALRHGLFIPDTRRRLARTAKYAFHRGGMVQRVKFGYRKLSADQAASGQFGPKDLRMARLPEFQPVFDKIRTLLLRQCPPSSVVDALNRDGVPVGPCVKRSNWDFKLFKNLVRDPILHGTRRYRNTIYRPVLKTGHHKREPNPHPELEYVAELAFMTREQQEEMLAAIGWTIDWGGNRPAPLPTIRCRSRSVWPQLAATCAICGSTMVVMGSMLKCARAQKRSERRCWNHVQAPIDLIRQRTAEWLLDLVYATPERHAALIESALQAVNCRHAKLDEVAERRRRESEALNKQRERLTTAIAESDGQLQSLLTKLASVEGQLADLERQITLDQDLTVPRLATVAEVETAFPQLLPALLSTSVEFADVLRQFFGSFVIHPVQALDTGQVRPRAILSYYGDQPVDAVANMTVAWNLFEAPVHISKMPKILAIKQEQPRLTYRQIAPLAETSYMTVKRALRYARLMEQNCTDDPYVILHELPANASRWRLAC